MRKISKKEKEKRKLIAFRVMIALLCIAVALVFIRSYYIKNKQNDLDIKSRYTFSVDIDAYGDAITEQYKTTTISYDDSNVLSTVPDVYLVKTEKIARTWINAYVEQYMSEYLPYSKAVRKMNIDNIEVLNEDEHIALISFSLILKNASSDYFLSWDGVTDDGRLKCEWVMEYYIDAHADNTATIYVSSAMSPEEYGIAKYNEKAGTSAGKENTANTSTDSLSKYVIRDNILSVTYDGGEHYTTVPLDVENLMYENNSSSTLKEGSYMITTSKTAFIYGGKQGLNDKMPVTICYSSDKGANWTTSELDNIYNADYYYVKFFDVNNGVVICGYAKSNDTNESSRIYKTSNGGESWETVGSGPATNIIKGVVYVTADVGFFCYDYVDGMDSNLYKTDDGGKTFAKVILEAQELDSSAANSQNQESPSKADGTSVTSESTEQLKWNDVYKEALVPVVDSTGIITIYLTQGKNGVYNDGKTAAKYQSSDNGSTWKYIGQMEIKD